MAGLLRARDRARAAAVAALVAANVIWASSYPATALALRAFPPVLLALLRLGVGGLALLPLLRIAPAGTAARAAWDRRTLALAALLGLVGFTLPVYLQIVGLARSTPALAAMSVALEPLLTAAIAAATLREPLPPARRAALLLATLGAWAIAGFPRPGATGYLLGELLLLAANLGFAAYNAYSVRLVARLPAPAATAATLLAGFVGTVPLWLATGASAPRDPGPAALGAAAFLALPGTAGAYLLWMIAVGRVPVTLAALFLYVQPVLGAALSVAVTGQRPAASFYLGATAILAALVLGQGRRRETSPATAP